MLNIQVILNEIGGSKEMMVVIAKASISISDYTCNKCVNTKLDVK